MFYGTWRTLPIWSCCMYTHVRLGRSVKSKISSAIFVNGYSSNVWNLMIIMSSIIGWSCDIRSLPKDSTRSWNNIGAMDVYDMKCHLITIQQPFDGYIQHVLRVSNRHLIHCDLNRYSVPAQYARKLCSRPCLCRPY